MKRFFRLTAGLLILGILAGCTGQPSLTDDNRDNFYTAYPEVTELTEGIAWPEGQVLPTFATPAEQLDGISVTVYDRDELLTVTALQGLVNKEKPRLYLYDDNPDEGAHTWAETESLGLNVTEKSAMKRYDLIASYANEADGVVLYSTEKSDHYRNLASTVAGIKNLLPMTPKVYDTLSQKCPDLKVKVDLTELTYTTPADIYRYLYDTYWKDCTHRLLVSANPGDPAHVRDMAAATGAAVVWLDCTNAQEKTVFETFLADMTPGNGVVMGWFTTERSGITAVTSYGLSTLPADLYANSTVFAGTDHTIRIPQVPNKPTLENKFYVALYVSDGDNLQYNQRYMRKLWDQSASDRGRVAINWTVSPALADAGPGLLNYYYDTATTLDCFVSGPSGLGYAMPVNTLEENGAPAQDFLAGRDDLFTKYVGLTETYLQRTGLRVVTVWDNLTPSQRELYVKGARHLYGLTVHDWFMGSNAASTVENGTTLVQQLTPCYAGNLADLKDRLLSDLSAWDGASPGFFSAQVSVWGEVKPAQMVALAEELEKLYPGQVEFVRADHYFALYGEAEGLPYDLTLSDKLTVTASSGDKADDTVDGTPCTLWEAEPGEVASLTYGLGDTYTLTRVVLRHAGEAGLEGNTEAFTLETSLDGETWSTVRGYENNARQVTDLEISPQQASFLRVTFTDPGGDRARLADIEIYGRR